MSIDDIEETEETEVNGAGAATDYTQEAFVPIFNVAAEEAPPIQPGIPSEDEQKSTLEKMYAKLGLKAKEVLTEEVQPLTDEQLKYVNRTSLLAARIFSSICMWGWSIFGIEYQIVAPTVEHSQKMIEPVLRIAARHTPVVGNISPDVDDIIEAATAISDYALYAMAMMQQIREDKLANGGHYTGTYRYTTGSTSASQNGFGGEPARSNDFRGYPPASNESDEASRATEYPDPSEHLTEYERQNRDALRQLSIRDFQARARKSGRV